MKNFNLEVQILKNMIRQSSLCAFQYVVKKKFSFFRVLVSLKWFVTWYLVCFVSDHESLMSGIGCNEGLSIPQSFLIVLNHPARTRKQTCYLLGGTAAGKLHPLTHDSHQNKILKWWLQENTTKVYQRLDCSIFSLSPVPTRSLNSLPSAK